MDSMTSHERGQGICEPHSPRLDGSLPGLDLSDVSSLLTRLIEERVPLALIADLAHPDGPGSDQIMASEARDVG